MHASVNQMAAPQASKHNVPAAGQPLQHAAMVDHDGDTWRVLSTGRFDQGRVICHLASITRFQYHANGRTPVQITDSLLAATVEDAFGHPRGYLSWDQPLRAAFERGRQVASDPARRTTLRL